MDTIQFITAPHYFLDHTVDYPGDIILEFSVQAQIPWACMRFFCGFSNWTTRLYPPRAKGVLGVAQVWLELRHASGIVHSRAGQSREWEEKGAGHGQKAGLPLLTPLSSPDVQILIFTLPSQCL